MPLLFEELGQCPCRYVDDRTGSKGRVGEASGARVILPDALLDIAQHVRQRTSVRVVEVSDACTLLDAFG